VGGAPSDPVALEHANTVEHQVQTFILIFTSILYEALPFIILGAIIAGMLEELVPQALITNIIGWLDRVLPPSMVRFGAILLGGLLGLIFPMCECGIIPVMRRLLRKGLPLSCCVSYLLAGPIINGVVMLSTAYAFWGQDVDAGTGKPTGQLGGLGMMSARMFFGYLVAVGTALVVEWQFQKYGYKLLAPMAVPDKTKTVVEEENGNGGPPKSIWQRVSSISETALHDFVDITVYLIIGALIASLTRLWLTHEYMAELASQQWVLAILIMMGLAILLCLCSEADAFVAASFVPVLPSAKLAFLVLGPMLDFKLYFMYTRVFRPRLIWTIISSVVVQVFLYAVLFHLWWQGYLSSSF
jgi:uncharacterized membrane protein YraQ (UPF0718 family)